MKKKLFVAVVKSLGERDVPIIVKIKILVILLKLLVLLELLESQGFQTQRTQNRNPPKLLFHRRMSDSLWEVCSRYYYETQETDWFGKKLTKWNKTPTDFVVKFSVSVSFSLRRIHTKNFVIWMFQIRKRWLNGTPLRILKELFHLFPLLICQFSRERNFEFDY